MDLNQLLHESLLARGADFFGVASLAPAQEAIAWQGGPALAAYPRALSIGVSLFHPIVDELPRREERLVAVSYRHHAYDLVNQRLDLIASQAASMLQRQGWRAYPVPASKIIDDERLCGAFSHKLAAHLSGLGWIGKSCLLITPQVGPRLRLTSILTDAPISPGTPLEDRCGDCQDCVDICPVQAFTGRPFQLDEPRERRFDAHKCERYFKWMEQQHPWPGVCGLCLYVCPYGHRAQVAEH